jgi:hypothetical protein
LLGLNYNILITIYLLLLDPHNALMLVKIYTLTNLRKPPYNIPDGLQP